MIIKYSCLIIICWTTSSYVYGVVILYLQRIDFAKVTESYAGVSWPMTNPICSNKLGKLLYIAYITYSSIATIRMWAELIISITL